MNAFEIVIDRLRLNTLSTGLDGWLYSLLTLTPYEGEDTYTNAVDETLFRLAAISVEGKSQLTEYLNSLRQQIARGG